MPLILSALPPRDATQILAPFTPKQQQGEAQSLEISTISPTQYPACSSQTTLRGPGHVASARAFGSPPGPPFLRARGPEARPAWKNFAPETVYWAYGRDWSAHRYRRASHRGADRARQPSAHWPVAVGCPPHDSRRRAAVRVSGHALSHLADGPASRSEPLERRRRPAASYRQRPALRIPVRPGRSDSGSRSNSVTAALSEVAGSIPGTPVHPAAAREPRGQASGSCGAQ